MEKKRKNYDELMQLYKDDFKVVKDASDFNSNGRVLKVVEINDSTCFFEVCKLNLSLKQNLCSGSWKLARMKSGEVP